jgi:hypothetical protein
VHGRSSGLEAIEMKRFSEAGDPAQGLGERGERQFRLIFRVSVVLFFAVGAVARLLPRDRRPWRSGRGARLPLIAEAKAAANRFIPFAFMG